jgi:hypothetical protein
VQITVIASDVQAAVALPLFAAALNDLWPACPWPVLAVGETEQSETFPTWLAGPSAAGRDETQGYVDTLYRYLCASDEDVVLLMLEDYILYSRLVIELDVRRAYEAMKADLDVGGVSFYQDVDTWPEAFYDGFLGEYRDVRRVPTLHAGLWRPAALRSLLERERWPRVLGTHYPPLVYVELMCLGEFRGNGVDGLKAHGSAVLPLLGELGAL